MMVVSVLHGGACANQPSFANDHVTIMILVTDSHVSYARGNVEPFFELLTTLGKTEQDIFFLGDILDLWIALPRYEEDLHREFADWCTRQKQKRTVGFVEGNHEFFLAEERGDCFSWCSASPWKDGQGLVFLHGDRINREDRSYLCFRRMTRNRVVKSLLRHLPGGPALVQVIKRGLNRANRKKRRFLPEKIIKRYADARFAEGARTIISGHFHREYCYRGPRDQVIYLLPDWFATRKVGVYSPESGTLETIDEHALR